MVLLQARPFAKATVAPNTLSLRGAKRHGNPALPASDNMHAGKQSIHRPAAGEALFTAEKDPKRLAPGARRLGSCLAGCLLDSAHCRAALPCVIAATATTRRAQKAGRSYSRNERDKTHLSSPLGERGCLS